MTDPVDRLLTKSPFHLDANGCDWVRRTLAEMDDAACIRHLFIHIFRGDDPAEIAQMQALAPAGVTRFFSGDGSGDLTCWTHCERAQPSPIWSAPIWKARG